MLHNIDFLFNHSTSIDWKTNFDDSHKNITKFGLNVKFIVYEEEVVPLSTTQRILFFILTIVICTVAYLGNVLVLYVNFTRKQRLLFRTCLISLAFSDILYVQVTALVYLPRLFISQSALWILGYLACALLPYLQTLAILVNSILLVCIAMDRYMAVVRIAKTQWEPGKLFCLTCCVLIWGMAAGISSPMISIYEYYKILVIVRGDEEAIENGYTAYICVSHKDQNSYIFSIIFSFIFVPLVLTFLWMNSVVAREIWYRRNIQCKLEAKQSGTLSNIPSTSSIPSAEQMNKSTETINKATATCLERKRRQERLFRVILILMAVFFVCRLPTWMFLIYQLNIENGNNLHWILFFTFGNMALLNCALNPYLYTFMSETIKVVSFLGTIMRGIFYSICKMFRRRR